MGNPVCVSRVQGKSRAPRAVLQGKRLKEVYVCVAGGRQCGNKPGEVERAHVQRILGVKFYPRNRERVTSEIFYSGGRLDLHLIADSLEIPGKWMERGQTKGWGFDFRKGIQGHRQEVMVA